MSPKEYGERAATKFNADNPGHFPGRPLFEGLVANAVRDAVKAERERWAAFCDHIATEILSGDADFTSAHDVPKFVARKMREGGG